MSEKIKSIKPNVLLKTINGTKIKMVDFDFSETHCLIEVVNKEDKNNFQTIIAKNSIIEE